MTYTGNCVVCGQRITMPGWEPYCCEVCFDSDDAWMQEMGDRMRKFGEVERE